MGRMKSTDKPKPFLSFAARIADGLNLFKHIVDHGCPISSKELASVSQGEELLIGTNGTPPHTAHSETLQDKYKSNTSKGRVLRALGSIGFVDEIGPQTWQATAITKAMATEGIAAGHRTWYVERHTCYPWFPHPP
jgi:hypothetical protein